MGSAPPAGTRMNGQVTVSGSFTRTAASSATANIAISSQAVERTNHGGGSCGNISESASLAPRCISSVGIVR